MTDLAGLLSRVEAASGPSRELDAVIWCILEHPDMKPVRNFFYTSREEWGYFKSNQPQPGMTFHDAPELTSSIDAVVALIERRLGKGWLWQVGSGIECEAVIWCMGRDYDDDHARYSGAPCAKHITVPLALLAALLEAIRSEITRGGASG